MPTVKPWLISEDADAVLRFLAEVFCAEELGRVTGPDGRVTHAETRIGDSVLMTLDAKSGWTPAPAYLQVMVEDLPSVVERATERGATVVTPPTLLVFGDLAARVRDPWANLWWVYQHVEDVGVTELMRRMTMPEALAEMTAYEDSLDTEMRRRADR